MSSIATLKHVCLTCNNVKQEEHGHSPKCCGDKMYYLGSQPRTPTRLASRAKWKDFYKLFLLAKVNFKIGEINKGSPYYDYASENELKCLGKYNLKPIKYEHKIRK